MEINQGVSVATLKKVYKRGVALENRIIDHAMTPEQWGQCPECILGQEKEGKSKS